MSDTASETLVAVTIDGREYRVPEGGNMLETSLALGLDLPYFCWHPAMGSVGACRQCAVMQYWTGRDGHEHEEIVMACMTAAEEGTRIAIEHPEARAFRARMIELMMLSHPHDCPVCDEGGECHLQDMTVMTGHVYRRYRGRKRTFRDQDLGPFVTHDLNRCIACYRCLRFYNEYAGGDDFGVYGNRNRVYFGRAHDGRLESPFSGNLIEVCPTGVFDDKPFHRASTRKWDLQTAPAVCPHCGLGCGVFTAARYGELRRVLDRYVPEVNGHFLCDRGRFGHGFVGAARLTQPLLRRLAVGAGAAVAALAPTLVPVSSGDALGHLAATLRRGAAVGIGSPRASLEDNFALRRLVGAERFFGAVAATEGELVGTLVEAARDGLSPASLADVGAADVVVVLGEDVTNTAPRLDLALRTWLRLRPTEAEERLHITRWNDAALDRLKRREPSALYVANAHRSALDRIAADVVRAAPAALTGFVAALAAALDGQPAPEGVHGELATTAGRWAEALRAARRPLIVAGTSLGDAHLLRAALGLARRLPGEPGAPRLLPVVPEADSVGLCLLGARPLDDALAELRRAAPATVIVLGAELERCASPEFVDELVATAAQLVVIGAHESALARRADLVLPAAAWYEATGTTVNNEGRAQRTFAVVPPAEGTREAWRWLDELHDWLRAGDEHESASALLDAARGATQPGAAEAATQRVAAQSGGGPDDRFDRLVDEMAAAVPALAAVRDVAPPADWRLHGRPVARQPARSSGRTAIDAAETVFEPSPPADPDSPLAFSLEGVADPRLPAALVPRYWAPGWNSVAGLRKFQQERSSLLRGGASGVRLLDGPGAAAGGGAGGTPPAPPPAAAPPSVTDRGFQVVPMYHLFGSEPLSLYTPEIAALAPAPYAALHPDDAATLGLVEGTAVVVRVDDGERRLPLRLRPDLARGCVALPVGVEGLGPVTLPDRAEVAAAGGMS